VSDCCDFRLLLDAGLVKLLGANGWKWKQLADIYKDPLLHRDLNRTFEDLNARNCQQVGRIAEVIKQQVKAECLHDTFPLILGGDQCVSLGSISAIKEARPDTAVVYVSPCLLKVSWEESSNSRFIFLG
jgi:arginase family enzyme